MPIGELDVLVTLLAPQVVRDADYNAPMPTTWAAQGDVWARVTEREAGEGTAEQQRVHTRRADVRIRWRSDVLPTWRVLIGTRVLQIVGVLTVGRQRWLDLSCTETDNLT